LDVLAFKKSLIVFPDVSSMVISRLRRPVAELLDKSFKGALTLPSIIILEKLRAVEASSAVSFFGG